MRTLPRNRPLRAALVAVLMVACAIAALVLAVFVPAERAATQDPPELDTKRPNIVFVFSNDDDPYNVANLPYVNGKFRQQATTFPNATFAYPLCCPSRASIMRGQYPHNTNLWTNTPEQGGGYPMFAAQGFDQDNMATMLRTAGYRTEMWGIYMNHFTPEAYPDGVPPGWDRFDPNPRAGRNRATRDRHTTTEAIASARQHVGSETPLFQWVSLYSPHSPFEFEDRYAGRCLNNPPVSPAYLEADLSDKPGWVRNMNQSIPLDPALLESERRDRCRAMQTVDNSLHRLVKAYEAEGELEETYFIFWTDNGWNHGEHGLRAKKYPYVESVSYPMIVRGPNVDQGVSSPEVIQNVDLLATSADIAGVVPPAYTDGRTALGIFHGNPNAVWPEERLIEGKPFDDGSAGVFPDYVGLRGEDYTYVRWATGETEYYDLDADPFQMEAHGAPPDPAERDRLDNLIDRLRTCAGQVCRDAQRATRGR